MIKAELVDMEVDGKPWPLVVVEFPEPKAAGFGYETYRTYCKYIVNTVNEAIAKSGVNDDLD